jgi:hypothetical protein
MKEGAGDDLLSGGTDDVDEADEDDAESVDPDILSETTRSLRDVLAGATDDESIPYLLRRNQVKDHRKTVGFGLQKKTRDLEDDVLREVKADLEIENLPATDLREAAYLAGLQNQERIKQILLEWGYEHRR